MRRLLPILATGTIVTLFAASAPPAFAKTVKACRADYAANKDSITAGGQTEKAYMAACKAAPGAPAPSADAASVLTKTKAECAAEYNANMKAIKANGQTKAAFDADCRAGTEKIGPAPAAAAAPAQPPPPADPMAPKPLMSPTAGLPDPAAPASAAAPSPAEAQLKAKCPSDIVVWVNAKSGVYDLPGARGYGKTKPGEFMCEMDAKSAGDRRAGSEKNP
jgi:hypothetical protein